MEDSTTSVFSIDDEEDLMGGDSSYSLSPQYSVPQQNTTTMKTSERSDQGVFSNDVATISLDPRDGKARTARGRVISHTTADQYIDNESDTHQLLDSNHGLDENIDESNGDNNYGHKPNGLETIAHMLSFIGMLLLSIAFVHWHYANTFLAMSTLVVVWMIVMYGSFMRQGEHKSIKTLLVVWALWILYSVLYYGFNVAISSIVLFALRDLIITTQLAMSIARRLLTQRYGDVLFGVNFMEKLQKIGGGNIVSNISHHSSTLRGIAVQTIPKRVSSLDSGASEKAAKKLDRDCSMMVEDLKQNLGTRWLIPESNFGFIIYQVLLAFFPFIQNNAVAYDVYWTIARVSVAYLLYKLIDDIYRPRLHMHAIKRSGPTIISTMQYVLYVHPYVMAIASCFLIPFYVYVCMKVREERAAEKRVESVDTNLSEYGDDYTNNTSV